MPRDVGKGRKRYVFWRSVENAVFWWAVGAAEPGRFVEGRAAEGRLGVDFCAKTISTLRKVADMLAWLMRATFWRLVLTGAGSWRGSAALHSDVYVKDSMQTFQIDGRSRSPCVPMALWWPRGHLCRGWRATGVRSRVCLGSRGRAGAGVS